VRVPGTHILLGVYVNHCHLLQHEDTGMMQPVEVVPFDQSGRADSVAGPEVARANVSFVDPHATGQTYPGFDVEPLDSA